MDRRAGRIADMSNSSFWIAVGLVGQILFTSRFLVQWIASERARRSLVPAAFWWLSLGGGATLLVTPAGESVLIDCGSRCRDARDAKRIAAAAQTLKLTAIDHHGLRQSNNPLLSAAIDPTVAIMLNGAYKGAHPDVHAALKTAPHLKAVYQLHKNLGRPAANPPSAYIANLAQQCDGIPIRVTVDGKLALKQNVRPSASAALRSYERRRDWGLIYVAEIQLCLAEGGMDNGGI